MEQKDITKRRRSVKSKDKNDNAKSVRIPEVSEGLLDDATPDEKTHSRNHQVPPTDQLYDSEPGDMGTSSSPPRGNLTDHSKTGKKKTKHEKKKLTRSGPKFSSFVNSVVKIKRMKSTINTGQDDIFTSVILDLIRGKETIPDNYVPSEDPSPSPIESSRRPSQVPWRKASVFAETIALIKKSQHKNAASEHSPLITSTPEPTGPNLLDYLHESYVFDEDSPYNYRKGINDTSKKEPEAQEGEQLQYEEAAEQRNAKTLAALRAKAKVKRQQTRVALYVNGEQDPLAEDGKSERSYVDSEEFLLSNHRAQQDVPTEWVSRGGGAIHGLGSSFA